MNWLSSSRFNDFLTSLTGPANHPKPIFAYGFRPFFWLVPWGLTLNAFLWVAFWIGWWPVSFPSSPLNWHIYELLFGITSGMMAAFIMTAVPEFFDGTPPVNGRTLFGLVALWLAGRLAFWGMDVIGVYGVAIIHLAFLPYVLWLVGKPILTDPLKRQWGLALAYGLIIVCQALFFAAEAEWVPLSSFAVLQASIGAFMILVLVAVRRIATQSINEWFAQEHIDERFLARPPAYNLAIFSLSVATLTELLFPGNSAQAWLNLAVMAALFNTLNDFFRTDTFILKFPTVWPIMILLTLFGAGYGLMGWDALQENVQISAHFRHFLTMGALGLAYFIVLMVVSHIHTGRPLTRLGWLKMGVVLITAATLIRGLLIPAFPEMQNGLYVLAGLLWTGAFIGYWWRYHTWLTQPRADGLPG